MPEGDYAFGGEYPLVDTSIMGQERKKVNQEAADIIKAIRKVRLNMLRDPCIQAQLKKDKALHYEAMENLPEPIGELPGAGLESNQCRNTLAEYSALQDLEDKLVKVADGLWYEAVQNERTLTMQAEQERLGRRHFMPWEFMIEPSLMR